MDLKALISILNRPWFIEPTAAQQYAEYAANIFRTGNVPINDTRSKYSWRNDDQMPLFRVNAKGEADPAGVVQVVRINYPIAKYDMCTDPGTQSLQQIFAALQKDESIKSIVLWLDSPGGQVDGTEAFAQAVKGSAKPVIAYSDSMICSAAYWIGSSSAEIIVHGSNDGWNATIGSIGTMAYWEDRSGKYEKEGVKVHTVFATESADKWGDHFKRNGGDYVSLIEELDGLNTSFLNAVKLNRAGKLNLEKENVLTGKTYNASQALEFGLIDKIDDFQYAVQRSLQLSAQQQQQQQQQQQNINMKYPKTMTAAKADQDFEILKEGVLLTEGHLVNIEQSITTAELSSSQATEQLTAANQELAELKQTNEGLTATVEELQAKVKTLEKLPGHASDTTTDGDAFQGSTTEFSHNVWADQMLGKA